MTQQAGSLALDRIASDEPVARMKLCADTESVDRTVIHKADLLNGSVGHAFINVRMKPGMDVPAGIDSESKMELEGGETQFGFYPAMHYETDPRHAWVAGSVHQPDYTHTAKASLEFDLSAKQFGALFGYVNAHRAAPYHLYVFNCTTFAVEAARAAGQVVPYSNVFPFVTLPNYLYREMLREERTGNPNAHTRPLGKTPHGEPETQEDEDTSHLIRELKSAPLSGT